MFDFRRSPSGLQFAALAAIAGAGLLSACSPAPDEPAGSEISVDNAWSRETAAGQPAGGAFMTIHNDGDSADWLLGGSSPIAGEVQVHMMEVTDGIMRMRQLPDGLEIAAGDTVTLRPGSYHIMLMQLRYRLAQGEPVPLTLHFAKAGDVEVQLAVQPISGDAPAQEHDHG